MVIFVGDIGNEDVKLVGKVCYVPLVEDAPSSISRPDVSKNGTWLHRVTLHAHACLCHISQAVGELAC